MRNSFRFVDSGLIDLNRSLEFDGLKYNYNKYNLKPMK
jgi:hypothetical protein